MRHPTLSWIPEKWWPLVTSRSRRVARVGAVDRRYFELCLFSQIWLELKSGDLAVEGSDAFSDYREQLVSQKAYDQGVKEYGEQVGAPIDGKTFVNTPQEWLETLGTKIDTSFPDIEYARIEHGESVLRKLECHPLSNGFLTLERAFRERMPAINIVDVLGEPDHWIQRGGLNISLLQVAPHRETVTIDLENP